MSAYDSCCRNLGKIPDVDGDAEAPTDGLSGTKKQTDPSNMDFVRQLGLLLWKNFTLRKRQPIHVLVELTWPLVLFFILMGVRLKDVHLDTSNDVHTCHFQPQALPSAGALAFLQSYVCRFQDRCREEADGSPQGVIKNFDTSLLDMAVSDAQTLLSSQVPLSELVNVWTDLDLLSQVLNSVRDNSTQTGYREDLVIPLGELLLDQDSVQKQLTNQSIGLTTEGAETFLETELDLIKILPHIEMDEIPDLLLLAKIVSELSSQDPTTALADVKTLLCDHEILTKYFDFKDPDKPKNLQNEMCNLTDDQLLTFAETMLNSIDADQVQKQIGKIMGQVPVKDLSPASLNALKVLSKLNIVSSSFVGVDLGDLGSVLCGSGYQPFKVNNPAFNWMKRRQKKSGKQTDILGSKSKKTKTSPEEEVISPDCAELFQSFESDMYTRIVWNEIKPIVLGVIPYAPNSPAARKIIKEVSKFFDYFKTLSGHITEFREILPKLYKMSEHVDIPQIKDFLKSTSCRNMVKLLSSPVAKAYLSNIDPDLSVDVDATLCDSLSSILSQFDGVKSADAVSPDSLTKNIQDTADTVNPVNLTQNILDRLQPYLKCFRFDKFIGYDTVEELHQNSLHFIGNKTLFGAIVFNNMALEDEDIPPTVKYTLRFDWKRGVSTRTIRDYIKRPSAGDSSSMYIYGILPLQDTLDHAIIKLHTNSSEVPGVFTQRFSYPCFKDAWYAGSFAETLPLFMALSWLFTVATIIKGIVYEREMRLKEVMRIMGLGHGVHWLAWFITSFAMMIISAAIICFILKVGLILERTDPLVIMVFMVAFITSTICECFLVSVFFDKANLAAVCGGFIFFIVYLPYNGLVENIDTAPTWVLKFACLSPNVAMGFGCYFLAISEEQTVGVQWSTIDTSPIVDGLFTLQDCIQMMFIDAIIFFVIAWYVEIVFPGQYGMPRKFWFFLERSYWCGTSSSTISKIRAGTQAASGVQSDIHERFEPEPSHLNVGVSVHNLTKLYSNNKLAVDHLTIKFYKDQITSFLGHNGAGKTTTMSILTGLFPPTSGTAYIDGLDILTDFDVIRRSLGMCPQHNVLFDRLTVEEHIWFYARLKGRSNAEIKVELEQMLQDIGLPHKRKEKSIHLSGGMKRKLSVAVAFVGGSQTVILDEPTAGVDPYARRAIWELLLKLKKGRTIILSTHHMDEADTLGDRIAIISQGKLCTVGSSLFLKKRFGNGYFLTLVKADQSRCLSIRTSHSGSRTLEDVKVDVSGEGMTQGPQLEVEAVQGAGDVSEDTPAQALMHFVRSHVPEAELVEENSMEICIRLPQENQCKQFQRLFKALEDDHGSLGISSYGVSDTSLEEVFLRVADESRSEEMKLPSLQVATDTPGSVFPPQESFMGRARRTLSRLTAKYRPNSMRRFFNEDVDGDTSGNNCSDMPVNYGPAITVTGKMLVLQQIMAVFIKRFHHVCRSKKGFVCEIFLPAAFVCIAMISTLVMPDFSEDPALELQPWMYESKRGSSLYTFYSNANSSSPAARTIEESIREMPYYGTRCMDPKYHVIHRKRCHGPGDEWDQWSKGSVWSNTTPHCNCDRGYQSCPSDLPVASERLIRNHDYLLNVTAWDIPQWLVDSRVQFEDSRMGGFSVGEKYKLKILSKEQIHNAVTRLSGQGFKLSEAGIGVDPKVTLTWADLEKVLDEGYTQDNVLVWQNSRGYFASLAYVNAVNNAMLRSFLPPHKDKFHYGIVAINHPIKFSKEQLSDTGIYQNGLVNLVVAVCVIFAMSFIPASFVLYLVEERVTKSKHLQFVSGMDASTYWLANWLWDMMNYAIPAVLSVLIFVIFDQEAYVGEGHLSCLIALLFLYGWAIVPVMYPFSRLFEVPSTAFVTLSCMNVFLGSISTLATFILETMTNDESLHAVNSDLKKVFLVLPHFCLGRGLMDMASYKLHSQVLDRYGENLTYDLLDWDIVGKNLFALFIIGIVCNIFNILHEYNFFLDGIWNKKPVPRGSVDLDEDVASEKDRVVSGSAEDDVLQLKGLCKVFSSPSNTDRHFLAVDHIYMGVPKGQCFGLLGVNGAGKSSLFKMLTGDISVTAGEAFICQQSITTTMHEARHFLGYCPQFDALNPLLTGQEHLEFYARIKGIPLDLVTEASSWASHRLGLDPYWTREAGTYSGGNKRKLSTAIALLGNPSVIFLDEPTTGMDPQARRFLWNCISNIVKEGRSVLLTSHSMEECEALCSRLAIMVNGSFQCMGSTQHLKSKFGSGYTVILRVSGENVNLKPIMRFVKTSFPVAVLKENHHNMLQYHLDSANLSLSQLFEAMEEAKATFAVADYSISQTTLDQVFIDFARKQKDLLDQEVKPQVPSKRSQFDQSSEMGVDDLNLVFASGSIGLQMRRGSTDHLVVDNEIDV